ncbi:MAG: monovalent cation/H+ antiporter subunit D, partial [Candidatus Tectomicrobia bacterium]|nr:monovalent cation/H+ antiporter subunit D [Candidatus Tectomicrobia bacterium]
MSGLLPLFVAGPLAAAIVLFLVKGRARLQEGLSLLALAANLALALALLRETAGGEIFIHRMGFWPFPYGILLAADRLAATMLCLSAAVVGASGLFAC